MWEIDLCYIYGLNTCSPVQGNESDRIPLGRNEFSCSPYGYTDSGEEWEEALWKDRQERNESMKSQDKEMSWQEPHTNGQTLIVLCTTVPMGKGWGWKKKDALILSMHRFAWQHLVIS